MWIRYLAALSIVATAVMAADTKTAVTFNKDIMPILQHNCQSCHRPGEVGPMPLLSYEGTRPWAKAIKTSVVSRKMPPWFADPAYGHFANARTWSDHDIAILTAWADQGALEGDSKTAPAPV